MKIVKPSLIVRIRVAITNQYYITKGMIRIQFCK